MLGFDVVIGSVCCKLDTLVYIMGMVMTGLYLLAGVAAIVWFVLTHSQSLESAKEMTELYVVMMESVKGSLAVMSGVLVVAFLGLLVSLVLVVGVKTEQRYLLLPWQIYHATLILAFLGGGLYLCVYHTVITSEKQYLLASISVFPLLVGIILIFLWILVHQLNIRFQYRKEAEKVLEEKRNTLADLTHSASLPHRSVRSIRTLKRGKKDKNYSPHRSRSLDVLDTQYVQYSGGSMYYSSNGRSRSLPRKLDWELMELQQDDFGDRPSSEVLRRRERCMRKTASRPVSADYSAFYLDKEGNLETLGSARNLSSADYYKSNESITRRRVQFPHAVNLKGSIKKETKADSLKRSKPNLDIFGTSDFMKKNDSEGLKPGGFVERITAVNFQETIPRPKIIDTSPSGEKENFLSDKSDEYTVPTPVYPVLPNNGVLTKSDIITMYCRER